MKTDAPSSPVAMPYDEPGVAAQGEPANQPDAPKYSLMPESGSLAALRAMRRLPPKEVPPSTLLDRKATRPPGAELRMSAAITNDTPPPSKRRKREVDLNTLPKTAAQQRYLNHWMELDPAKQLEDISYDPNAALRLVPESSRSQGAVLGQLLKALPALPPTQDKLEFLTAINSAYIKLSQKETPKWKLKQNFEQWSKLDPAKQLEDISYSPEIAMSRMPAASYPDVLTHMARNIADLPPEQNKLTFLSSIIDAQDRADLGPAGIQCLVACAEAGHQLHDGGKLVELHGQIDQHWPTNGDARLLVERLIDNLDIIDAPGDEFVSLVYRCDEQEKDAQPALYSQLFLQLRYLPEDALPDAVACYFNHVSELSDDRLKITLDSMRRSLPDWPDPDSFDDANDLVNNLTEVLEQRARE